MLESNESYGGVKYCGYFLTCNNTSYEDSNVPDTKVKAKTNTEGRTISQLPGHPVLLVLAVV